MIRLSESSTWVDYNAIFSDRCEWNDFIVRLNIIIKKDLYTHFSRTKFFGPALLSSGQARTDHKKIKSPCPGGQDGTGQQDSPALMIISEAHRPHISPWSLKMVQFYFSISQ